MPHPYNRQPKLTLVTAPFVSLRLPERHEELIFIRLPKLLVIFYVLPNLEQSGSVEVRFDRLQDILIVIGDLFPFHLKSQITEVSDTPFGVCLICSKNSQLRRPHRISNMLRQVLQKNRLNGLVSMNNQIFLRNKRAKQLGHLLLDPLPRGLKQTVATQEIMMGDEAKLLCERPPGFEISLKQSFKFDFGPIKLASNQPREKFQVL
jgi:hypothetical protein